MMKGIQRSGNFDNHLFENRPITSPWKTKLWHAQTNVMAPQALKERQWSSRKAWPSRYDNQRTGQFV
ncbi:nucleosome remodeling complex atpase subunit [Moniliophthora roreri]|nr:nucleosome remodeling complex atpase subunit [Moniliophthora roreri]